MRRFFHFHCHKTSCNGAYKRFCGNRSELDKVLAAWEQWTGLSVTPSLEKPDAEALRLKLSQLDEEIGRVELESNQLQSERRQQMRAIATSGVRLRRLVLATFPPNPSRRR